MLLHAQFAGLTSLQSPKPSSSHQAWKLLSRPTLPPCSSHSLLPHRFCNHFRHSFRLCGAIHRSSALAAAEGAAHSEPAPPKPSCENSIFLHILDERQARAPLRPASENGGQELGKRRSPIIERFYNPGGSADEDFLGPEASKVERNAPLLGVERRKVKNEEFGTGTRLTLGRNNLDSTADAEFQEFRERTGSGLGRSRLDGAADAVSQVFREGTDSGLGRSNLDGTADAEFQIVGEGTDSGFNSSSDRAWLADDEEDAGSSQRLFGQRAHAEDAHPTETAVQSSGAFKLKTIELGSAESREIDATDDERQIPTSTTRTNVQKKTRGGSPELPLFEKEQQVEPTGTGVSDRGRQLHNLASETEHFSGRRERLKVGRRVFLTGEPAYKRWMPSSEDEDNVQGIVEECRQDEEVPYTISPIAESGASLQAVHGDDGKSGEREQQHCEVGEVEQTHALDGGDGKSGEREQQQCEVEKVEQTHAVDGDDGKSGEREQQQCEVGEVEQTQSTLETSPAIEGETSQDLLFEFLKKRSAQWGDDGDGWLRVAGLSRDDGSRSFVGDAAVVQENQARASLAKIEVSSNRSSNSSTESVKKQLLYVSGKGVPAVENISETPSLSLGDEKHRESAALTLEIVNIAKSLPLNASLENFLTPFCGKISTSDGNLVLKSLGEMRLAWPMLSFFQWMRVHDPSLLDSRSFCTVFAHLGKLGMVNQALLLYSNMPESRAFHCTQVYNSLLAALVRSDRKEKMPQILQEMEDRHIERDVFTYSILITATKGGKERVDKVWSIFDDMQREGVRPSMVAYGSIIKAFCDGGHLKQALLVSLSMEKMGISPNVIIYNTLIDAHGKALQLEEAEGLLLEMKERQLHPSEATYNALINGYGRSGQLDVAEELVLEMQREGLKPNVFTYTSLISAYGKQKMSEKAANVFLRMRKSGIMPTTHTYTVVINAYAESGWHEKAQRAFDNMIREGLKPTVETYTALLDGYRRAGDLEMVRHVWNTIKQDGCELTKVTYRTIMDAFGKYGLYVEARDVMEEFRKRGMEPDTMIFNILLNAYARGGVGTKLPKVLLEIQAAGCEPDSYTYCTLIYSCIRRRHFTGAFKYNSEMIEKGLMPEPKVYRKMKVILDAKYALKVENDKKADSGHDPDGQKKNRKNPQRAKRKFKQYQKRGPLRGSKHTNELWKDKEGQS